MVPNETTRCEAENCRLEVGLGGRGVLAQPLLFDQPRYQVKNCSQEQVRNCSQVINTPLMQVISSSPPSPALASLRVVPRGGGRVVSGCKGTSGQVCAPPGGSCSPGFSCRVGYELIPRTLALGMRGSLQRQMSV